ncbi:MAG: hypothetical protein HYZ72_09195, partial [Deltaproteobacteria bacterium]|nr:hypothetical protein [Deltaproteobacteria bacterium]
MAERRYGFRFSLPEGCVILVSLLLASFLVFVFGAYVGKEMEARKAAEQTRTIRLPVSSSEEAPPARLQGEMPSLLWKLPAEKPTVTPPSSPVSIPPAQKPLVAPPSAAPAPAGHGLPGVFPLGRRAPHG